MHNSSSNTQSVLGSLLSLAPSASSPTQKTAAMAQKQAQDTKSFSDTFTGVRQEVTRAKPAARRPAQLRPDQDQRANQAASADRSAGLQSQRKSSAEAPAKNPANPPAISNQKHAAKVQSADGQQQKVDAGKKDKVTASESAVQADDGNLDIAAVMPLVLEADLESTAAVESPEIVAEGLLAPNGTIAAEVNLITTEIVEELPLAGNAGLAEEDELDSAMIPAVTITVLAEKAVVAAVVSGAPLATSPADKVSLGSESLLAKAATAAVADSAGDISSGMSDKQDEAMGNGGSKESFAKLLASATDAKPLTREPAVTQAAPAIETIARAVESLTPAGRGFVVQSGVAPTVGHPQWSQAVGDRVLWLAAQNITSAELRLDPPELGPMQVRISVHQDQVQVTFTSPHAGVREALDQGATRLREMFNEQGLNLNVDVSDQSLSRRQEREGSSKERGNGEAELPAEDNVVAETAITQMRLIDHYA